MKKERFDCTCQPRLACTRLISGCEILSYILRHKQKKLLQGVGSKVRSQAPHLEV